MSASHRCQQPTAPVIVFVYNRPSHTVQTIEALSNNSLASETDLVLFSDAHKGDFDRESVTCVRKFISTIKQGGGFRSVRIFEAEHNRGLARSVIAGVTRVIEEAGRVIVLEDDHVTTPDFLDYMNSALVRYQPDPRVWSISGYSPPITLPSDYVSPVFFTYRGSSWGYATWKDRWAQVDWTVDDYPFFRRNWMARAHFNRSGRDLAQMLDRQMEGQIDSWAIRWCYAQAKLQKLTVYPRYSLLQNIGLDGSGTHSGFASQFSVSVGRAPMTADLCDPFVDARVLRSFRNMYGSLLQQVKIAAAHCARQTIDRGDRAIRRRHALCKGNWA